MQDLAQHALHLVDADGSVREARAVGLGLLRGVIAAAVFAPLTAGGTGIEGTGIRAALPFAAVLAIRIAVTATGFAAVLAIRTAVATTALAALSEGLARIRAALAFAAILAV
ncbi:hypothetical protein BMR85_012810 [Achromobacter sp. KAs 3-5]|nr:hypothetical protein BMR85_012810 [Achromobacter sp. KAs 3-5]